MIDRDADLWTIEELGGHVADALAIGYTGVPSGRVRDVPDARTIRYYTTLGLIDRAAEMRGRTAFYGRRHLLQLVAIKRLQADGRSLAEVQQAILGRDDAALERLAGPIPERSNDRRSGAGVFWKRRPAPALPDGPSRESVPQPAPGLIQGVPLATDLTLLIAMRRSVNEDDLRTIRMAAAPLLELLRLRGLIGPSGPGASDDASAAPAG